jgi:hypothetical protein
MLLKAIIERFAIDNESCSMFYKILLEEFSIGYHIVIKEKCTGYILKIIKRLDEKLLVSLQASLETFLKQNFFLTEPNKVRGTEIAEYLISKLEEDLISPFIFQEFIGESGK